jgi:hypothetical protein
VLQSLFRELVRLEFRVPPELFTCSYDLYNGDFLKGSGSDIFLRAR